MKGLMGLYPVKTPAMVPGRKQPLGYVLSGRHDQPDLFVPGHYESPCGGCDTISKYDPSYLKTPSTAEKPNSYDVTFGLIREQYALGRDVAFEGLLISGDASRCIALHQGGLPLKVVVINLPVDACLQSVRDRRAAAGNEKEFNEKNTREKHRLLQSCITKLREAGVDVRNCHSRELAAVTAASFLDVEGARVGLEAIESSDPQAERFARGIPCTVS